MSNVYKFAVLTLAADDAAWAKAIFNGSVLAIDNPVKVPQKYTDLMALAEHTLHSLGQKDYVVLVDGSNKDIARAAAAIHVDFNVATDKENPLALAYSRYVEMNKLGMIIYPTENGAAYKIAPNMVNISRSPAGDMRYEFDWQRIKPSHLITLMLCYGIAMPQVSRPGFFRRLFEADQKNHQTPAQQKAVRTLSAIDRHFQETSMPPAGLAGTKISDDEWIL